LSKFWQESVEEISLWFIGSQIIGNKPNGHDQFFDRVSGDTNQTGPCFGTCGG
jgi:hypothetical protein